MIIGLMNVIIKSNRDVVKDFVFFQPQFGLPFVKCSLLITVSNLCFFLTDKCRKRLQVFYPELSHLTKSNF